MRTMLLSFKPEWYNRIKDGGKLEYWYGDKERKERAKDLAYVKEHFLHVKFIEMKNMGHASMATLYPENMAERIMDLAK